MVAVPAGRVVETKTTEKTTGGADLPNTKQPTNSEAYNNANAPYAHDSQDVSKYIGVTSEYRTYADVRNQPFGQAGDKPVFLMAGGDGEGEGPGALMSEPDSDSEEEVPSDEEEEVLEEESPQGSPPPPNLP